MDIHHTTAAMSNLDQSLQHQKRLAQKDARFLRTEILRSKRLRRANVIQQTSIRHYLDFRHTTGN